MDSSTKSPIIVGSLCTGYGGIELGLKRIFGEQMRTAFYVEVEAFAVANLVSKIEEGRLDAAPVWTDIKTFNGKPFRGKVDIITSGVPCQPWSVAGKRKGTKDDRWIWDDIFRIIVEVQPGYVFLEEVPGFVSGGGLGFVLSDLAKAGFDAEWSCFTAAEVGAPHKRQRLFIMANNTQSRSRGLPIRRWRQEQASIDADGSSEAMGNSESNDKQQVAESTMYGQGKQIGRSSSNVANAECSGEGQGVIEKAQAGIGRDRLAEQRSSLADAERAERRTAAQIGNDESDRTDGQRQTSSKPSQCRWPARPGQPQYEWEEPRVVEYAGSGTSKRLSQSEGRNIDREVGNASGQGQAEFGVGESTYGTSKELDAVANRMEKLNENKKELCNLFKSYVCPSLPKEQKKDLFNRLQGEICSEYSQEEYENVLQVLSKGDCGEGSITNEILQQRVHEKELYSRTPHQENGQKTFKQSSANRQNEVLTLWFANKITTASLRYREHAKCCGDTVPKVSYSTSYPKQNVGYDATRIDRLRLLGNGVVPQCAEKAIRELVSIVNNKS